MLHIMKLSATATLPQRSSPKAAGYDLSAAENIIVPAQGKAVVKTDLAIACPSGTYGRIAPRSGLAVKHFIDVGAGVIDEDYRGNIGVVLFNHSNENFNVKIGDRIAQLIIEVILTPEIITVDELSNTIRGDNGYGSTGF